MRCNKRKGVAFYKKNRAPNTNQNAYINPRLACAKTFPRQKQPLIAELYVAFTM